MFEHSTVNEMLAGQRYSERLREAEQHRLAKLATADQKPVLARAGGILAGIRQAVLAPRRTFAKPSVTSAG